MKFPINVPYHLFSSCITVKGITRSIIYDLQRNNFEYIPNSLFEILDVYKDITFENLLEKIEIEKDKNILINYFDFLYENEFIFFSKLNSSFFPKYQNEFITPFNISCLVIDFEKFDLKSIEIIKSEIIKTKVHCLVFRFISLDENRIKDIVGFFNDILVRTIHLFVEERAIKTDSFLDEMMNSNSRISIILKYSSISNLTEVKVQGVIISTKLDLINEKSSIDDISDFTVNLELFMESKSYNNYFNKRAYIDSKGNIHRFENDLTIFGNIYSNSLIDIIKENDFKEFWNISKDKIKICCNCEYRYMCVDNRKPLFKDSSNFWELEGVCNYDPSLAKWNK